MYNLRSKNTHSSASDVNGGRHSRISDIFYPQLQIDTQKSPKCVNQTSCTKESSIPTTSPSASAHFAEAHSRLSLVDDSLRSDFRRPYPQLEISIKKSPRSIPVEEKPQPASRLRKRKINFIENTPTSDGSFDMSSVAVRWKKRLKPATPIVNEFSDSLPMDTDINSQKYSLKIQFNADELEEKMYSDVLLKKPAILLKRISLDSVAKEPKSILPSKCLSTSLVSDTVKESKHPNCRMEGEICGSSPVSENLKSNDKLMPKVSYRKRLGMRMRGKKYVNDQVVGSTDLSQDKTVKGIAADEACQSNSIASDKHIERNAFVEQSGSSAENAVYRLLSKPKIISACDVSVNLTRINELDFGKSEENPEMGAEYSENRSFSHEMTDSNKRFQFKDKPNQSKAINTQKIRLCNAGGNVGDQNMSRNRRVKKLKVTGAERSSKVVVRSKTHLPVDAMEPCLNDNEKKLVLTNCNYAENFKLKDVSVNLKAINIDRLISHNEKAVINSTEKLPILANLLKVGTKENSKITVASNNMDSVHPNEPSREELNVLNSNAAKKVTYTCSDESSTNVVDVSKPCFSDSDDDVIMVISDSDSQSGGTSSGSTSNVNYTPAFPNPDNVDGISGNLVDDEEIERIALSIINQTAAAFSPTSDETIKFTELTNIEEVPSTQELNYSIKEIESGSTDTDKPNEHCVNQNNAKDLANFEKLEHSVSDDDELVLSDDDTHLKASNKTILVSSGEISYGLEVAVNNQSIIDETIKFTELECEDALNDVELENIETRLDKSMENNVLPTCANEEPKSGFEVNQHLSEPTNSPISKMVSNNPPEYSVDIDENGLSHSKSVHHCSPECQRLSDKYSVKHATAEEPIFCSQRSGRVVKSLRWAIDEFDNVLSTSRHPLGSRSEGSEKTGHQRISPLSLSLFTSAADQSDIHSPTADHLLNRPQTQELFSPLSPKNLSQSSNEDVIQIRCSNDENTSIQRDDGSSSSTKKTAAPGSLDTIPGSKINYKFDNSIWYSSDEENDDNRVCSLYQNESASSPEVVLFPESRLDSPKGEDPVVDSNEKSSSQETNKSDSEIVLHSQSPGSVSQISKDFAVNDSPVDAGRARRGILHSTPTGRRSKKSPSPTYTPIYKKLMLKVMKEEERAGRREPKMGGIKEELETKAADVSSSSVVSIRFSEAFLCFMHF